MTNNEEQAKQRLDKTNVANWVIFEGGLTAVEIGCRVETHQKTKKVIDIRNLSDGCLFDLINNRKERVVKESKNKVTVKDLRGLVLEYVEVTK